MRRLSLFSVAFFVVGVCLQLEAQYTRGSGAAGPPQPREEGGRTVIREKTVYVPYDKLENVFESEDRGIFLPYNEFLKLWQSSLPKPPQPGVEGPPADAVVRSASYTGEVVGDAARLKVTYTIESLKKGWSEMPLPLEGVAVESIELSDAKALIAARGEGYSVYLPHPGRYEVKLQLSVHVQKEPGKKTLGFAIPPTALSRLELKIPETGARVQVEPKSAVSQTTQDATSTKIVTFLGNSASVNVSWQPPAGKVQDTGAVLVAEQAVQNYLGARVLKSSTRIDFSVLRGEVDSFRVRLPEGMRLLKVKGDNIREWDQEEETLVVHLHTAVKENYRLDLRFEKILPETPESLTVPFAQAEGVLRESGYVVLGNETGLHVRVATTTGLSQLDPDEVPESLRPQLGTGFQYLAHPLRLELQVEKILPQVRTDAVSIVSLGEEEDVWIGWVDYNITKAGLFRLQLRVPERWSVASVGTPATVEDFQVGDADDQGRQIVTVSLKSKAIGEFQLPFRFTAEGSIREDGERAISPPEVLGVEQDRGLFGVSTPRAYDLVTVSREKLLDADVNDLFRAGIMSQLGSESAQPRAFRYRAHPASANLRVEAKTTEIDVLAQHLIEVRDGNIKITHILDYNILYAAVDRLRFRTPSSLQNVPEKVEAANEKEVKEVSTDGTSTVWELTLQSPTLGSVTLMLTHEIDLKALESGKPSDYAIPLLQAVDVRAERGFVAVQKRGTLEIVATTENMEAIEPSDLTDKLRRGSIYSSFRYFTANPSLALKLTHYEYESLATTVVNLLHVKSVLSEDNKLKSEATLFVQNTDRQYLEVQFAPGAEIFSLTVSGKTQPPNKKRKDTDIRLIPIAQSASRGGTFPVVIVYEEPLGQSALGSSGSVDLTTLEILGGVPVAKVELDLYLPPDYAYVWWGGNLGHHSTTGLWSQFKHFVGGLADTSEVVGRPVGAAPRRPRNTPPPESIRLALPTRDLQPIRMETLSPLGSVRFTYVGRRLFTFLDLLTLIATLVGGYLLVTRVRWPRLRVVCGLIFIPLMAGWFTTSAIAEIYTSVFAGGLILGFVFLAEFSIHNVKEWRSSRRLKADPYLEGATLEEARHVEEAQHVEETMAVETPKVDAPAATPEPPPAAPKAEDEKKKRGKKSERGEGKNAEEENS